MSEPSQSSHASIVDTTDERFELDVIERSRILPVVVDFWAEWCQPCRMLAPVLEKLATDYAGRFTLVRANTDQNQQAAAEFRVSALPTVYGVVDGEPIDFFTGVLPHDQISNWLERLLLSGRFANAQQIEADDAAAAEKLYRELLEDFPNHGESMIGLARVLLLEGKADEAREILKRLEARGFLEPAAQKLKAQMNLHQIAAPDLPQLREAVEKNPDDLQRRVELAEALAAGDHFEEALEVSLEIVRRDRRGYGEKARQIMVDIFHVLPDDSELTSEYRRKLSTALY